jgi:hypothetical protein
MTAMGTNKKFVLQVFLKNHLSAPRARNPQVPRDIALLAQRSYFRKKELR